MNMFKPHREYSKNVQWYEKNSVKYCDANFKIVITAGG